MIQRRYNAAKDKVAVNSNELRLDMKIESENKTANPDLCWVKAKDTSAVNFPASETSAVR